MSNWPKMESFMDLAQIGATIADIYSRTKEHDTMPKKAGAMSAALKDHVARTAPAQEADFEKRAKDEVRVKQLITKLGDPGKQDVLGRWMQQLRITRPHSHQKLVLALAQLSVDHEKDAIAYIDFLGELPDNASRNIDAIGAGFMKPLESDYFGHKVDTTIEYVADGFRHYWRNHRAYNRAAMRRAAAAAQATNNWAEHTAAPKVINASALLNQAAAEINEGTESLFSFTVRGTRVNIPNPIAKIIK